MKVLFVDDEPRVLEGIERSIYTAGLSWEVRVAEGGEAALELLREDEADVVVSDMRMPRMDGAELLGLVRASYPRSLRIILTGQSGEEAALRAVGVAHRFIAKPCDIRVLESVVTRAARLKLLLKAPQLQAFVRGVERLPSSPRAYGALTAKLANPKTAMKDVADIIHSDTAMSTKVLHLVNSAFFRSLNRVASIHVAVARLGLLNLRRLVLAAEIFDGASGVKVDFARLQRESLRASELATLLGSSPSEREDAATAALLCEVGVLVLALGNSEPLQTPEEEVRVRGVTHAEIGAFLLESWGLPEALVEAVAFHHRPEDLIAGPGAHLCATTAAAVALSRELPLPAGLATLISPEEQAEWTRKADVWRASAGEGGR